MNAPNPRTRLHVTTGALAAVLFAGLLAACSKEAKQGPKGGGVPVAAETVKDGNLDVYLTGLGTVTPVNTVTVASRVAGALKELHFTEGQMVKTGDLLAVIDPTPYEAALTQAQGQLTKDQALLKNANIDLQRYQNAFSSHAIPEQQLATQQATVEGDQGTVKVDEGDVAAAQVNVDYARITSPIDGRVGLRNVDLGNIVPANGTTGITTITQLQPITVVFTIAEDDLNRVNKAIGMNPKLKVDALDRSQTNTLATGSLLTLDNQVNVATGTVRAKAEFDNAKLELFPNQFVNVKLTLRTLKNVPLIPTAAIQRNNDQAFVYVIGEDKKVTSRNIKVTATDQDSAAVTGVKEGEQIVTDGFDKLQNGVEVTIKTAAQQTPNAPSGGDAAPPKGAKGSQGGSKDSSGQ